MYFAVHSSKLLWNFIPQFLSILIPLLVTFLIRHILLPRFWKQRAKELVKGGHFESAYDRRGNRRLVLELGCNEGSTSAIFVQAIIDRQRDISNLSGPLASLPLFVGYDRWSRWSRIPNLPEHYLQTMISAGVPREYVIANRVADPTTREGRTTLPYASNSISLVISNMGLTELCKWYNTSERVELFRELARVLEPGGRMIVVESSSPSRKGLNYSRLKSSAGPMGTYKQLLVEEQGWPEGNVVTKKKLGINFLVGIKPV